MYYTQKEVEAMIDRERSRAKYHEQCLFEMLVSVAMGAVLAALLCLVLPGIDKSATFAYFLLFWIVSAIGTWTVIDIADRRRSGRCDGGRE